MITFGTPALLALLNAGDPDHARIASQIAQEPGPLVLPVSLLGEFGYSLERRAPFGTLRAFLCDIVAGAHVLD
jgi:hypothetical protein